jgi:protoporphyrinogen oxidase
LAKRTPRLGYFEGGFQRFLDHLADAARKAGARIHLNHHVRGIHPQRDRRIRLELRAGDQIHERVLATCSPHMLQARTPTLPDAYTEDLDALTSMGAVVMVLALNQPVTDTHYWINIPKREGFPFLAFVEHTNYMDAEHYGGDTIVYCGDYLRPDHPYFEMEPEALLDTYVEGIKRINPDFDRSWIRASWKFTEQYAQPVPFVNHARRIPPIETPIANLYMANMSQVYPWDRGTNYAVVLGREAADIVEEV